MNIEEFVSKNESEIKKSIFLYSKIIQVHTLRYKNDTTMILLL